MSGGVDISAEAVEMLALIREVGAKGWREEGEEAFARIEDETAATLRALRAALDAAQEEATRRTREVELTYRVQMRLTAERDAADATGYARGVRDAANEAHERWVWGAPPEGTEGAILALLPAADATKETRNAE